MVKPIESRVKREAYAIIVRQLLGVPLLSACVLMLVGKRESLAFFIGGMAYSLPDLLFVWRFFRYFGTKAITEFMARFFAGKMVKLILRSLIVVYAAIHLPGNALWVFIGFISCTFIFWAACMMHFSRQRGAV